MYTSIPNAMQMELRYLAARWNMKIIEGGRQLEPWQQCRAEINDRYPALQQDNRIRLIHHRCIFKKKEPEDEIIFRLFLFIVIAQSTN